MHKLEMVRVSAQNAVPTDVRWCAARSAPAAVARAGGSNDRRLVLRFRVRPGRPSSRSRRTGAGGGPRPGSSTPPSRGPPAWPTARQPRQACPPAAPTPAAIRPRGLAASPRPVCRSSWSRRGFGTRTQPAAHSLSRRRTKTLSSASLRDPYLAIGVSRRTCPGSERPLSHLWRRRRKKSRITKFARLIKSLCQNTKKVVKTKLLGIKSQNDDHRTRSKD